MAISWEALIALGAVIVFGIDTWLSKSLLAFGLALLALALMLHIGVHVT